MEEEEHGLYGGDLSLEPDLDSADVDMSAADDHAVKELDEMKRRLKEMEDEVTALCKMQSKVEKEMGAVQDPTTAASQANKEEMETRWIYFGQLVVASLLSWNIKTQLILRETLRKRKPFLVIKMRRNCRVSEYGRSGKVTLETHKTWIRQYLRNESFSIKEMGRDNSPERVGGVKCSSSGSRRGFGQSKNKKETKRDLSNINTSTNSVRLKAVELSLSWPPVSKNHRQNHRQALLLLLALISSFSKSCNPSKKGDLNRSEQKNLDQQATQYGAID